MKELENKFLDPNLKNKSKTVEEKIQLFEYNGKKLPLPTELRSVNQEHVTDPALLSKSDPNFEDKKNLLQMNYIKNYTINLMN